MLPVRDIDPRDDIPDGREESAAERADLGGGQRTVYLRARLAGGEPQ